VQFRGQTLNTTTPANGRWQVWLNPLNGGDSGDMTIAGRNTLTVRDVLAGEVWVGSGQSNMQWALRQSNNAEAETRGASFPQIRLFYVPRKSAATPQDDVEAKWEVCTPESAAGFSAVMYFFGRDLHKQMNVPFGLIHTSWGGTPAQSWASREALSRDAALMPILGEWTKVLDAYPEAFTKYQKAMVDWDKAAKGGSDGPRRPAPPMGPGHAHEPAGLYNAMIYPIVKYTIKGAIWYQGETNATRIQAPLYQRLFETMIQDWRRSWEQGDFPFLWVQLANFAKAGSPSDWVLVQEAQTKTTELKATGMAVINDIGEPNDIHPKNKQDVGGRLARIARHVAYREDLVYTGPRFRQATTETATTGDRGATVRVWFDSVGGGLKARNGGALKGFEVAGEDKRFYPAEARVEGATVVASSPSVVQPVAVRYAWGSNPDANLVNAEGLPAGVFRSVDW
jgi:sialate O-acetylesterase